MRLPKTSKEMMRRVFVAGNAGYFHDEVAGESWGVRKRCLDGLKAQGLLRTSTTKGQPPRILWHLTPQGAALTRKLWCHEDPSDDRASMTAPVHTPVAALIPTAACAPTLISSDLTTFRLTSPPPPRLP